MRFGLVNENALARKALSKRTVITHLNKNLNFSVIFSLDACLPPVTRETKGKITAAWLSVVTTFHGEVDDFLRASSILKRCWMSCLGFAADYI
ncbi:unnamed protein product [Amaranthus hypochondriacus]